MISLSHWGMFDGWPEIIMIPDDLKLSREDIEAWRKPGQLILISKGNLIETLDWTCLR